MHCLGMLKLIQSAELLHASQSSKLVCILIWFSCFPAYFLVEKQTGVEAEVDIDAGPPKPAEGHCFSRFLFPRRSMLSRALALSSSHALSFSRAPSDLPKLSARAIFSRALSYHLILSIHAGYLSNSFRATEVPSKLSFIT